VNRCPPHQDPKIYDRSPPLLVSMLGVTFQQLQLPSEAATTASACCHNVAKTCGCDDRYKTMVWRRRSFEEYLGSEASTSTELEKPMTRTFISGCDAVGPKL